MGREEQVNRAAWLLAVIAHGSQPIVSRSVAVTALRQGRTHLYVGRIALTRTAAFGRVLTHPQPGIGSFRRVPHILFVLWSPPPDYLTSDRLRWIHSLAPLRVCLACIALKLLAQSSWVRSIHCGTAAVVLAVVVSSGTGGGVLACVCFCCGGIFG